MEKLRRHEEWYCLSISYNSIGQSFFVVCKVSLVKQCMCFSGEEKQYLGYNVYFTTSFTHQNLKPLEGFTYLPANVYMQLIYPPLQCQYINTRKVKSAFMHHMAFTLSCIPNYSWFPAKTNFAWNPPTTYYFSTTVIV